jgi:hypothetical protein
MKLPEFPYSFPEIEILRKEDIEAQRSRIEAHVPFVVRGHADGWTLVKDFRKCAEVPERIQVLGKLIGDARIPYTCIPPEQKGDLGIGKDLKANFRFDSKKTGAREFIEEVTQLVTRPTGACVYAQSLDLAKFDGIASRTDTPDALARSDRYRYSRLWIGSGNHVVDLHFDNAQNFITMAEGIKRITLMPPTALPYLYPAPLHRQVGGVTRSMVKLLDANLDDYPRFSSALNLASMTILQSGDLLHIPPLWWHHVESYGFNVMVNSWYDDNGAADKAAIKVAQSAWNQAILRSQRLTSSARIEISNSATLAALPRYWREYYDLLYDYYVTRKHGNPYPTLPGAMNGVVRAIRYQRWRRMRHRVGNSVRRLLAG